jgi:predicted GNAT family N-acyltransferase
LICVFVDSATQTSRPVPQALRDVLLGYEAGEAMLSVRTGSWAELGTDAQALRTAVFVDEQGIAAELDADGVDAAAVRAVAHNRLKMPLATGRLLRHASGVAKVGRMAVVQAVRCGGAGRAVLAALMTAARERGDVEVMLHAQSSAVVFYLRQGFVPRGAAFEEVGIEHQEMVFRF